MHCEQFRDQLTDYVSAVLDPKRRARVESHLSCCRSCREEADSIEGIWEKLGQIRARVPDSAAMRVRYDELIAAYRGGIEEGAPASWWVAADSWMRAWWPRRPVVQFGLALVLFVLGLAVGPRVRPSGEPVQEELGALRDELRQTQQLVTLSLMRQQSASERLRGVNWSNRIDTPGNEVLAALLDTLMRDPNVNVRLAAVDALRKFPETRTVRQGALEALTEEQSPLVQSELIGLMVDFNETGAADVLRQIAADATVNESVREHAEWGLEQFR